jgi:hypothetical protein
MERCRFLGPLGRFPLQSRVNRFSYAIRNIVAEAQAVEAAGNLFGT